MASDIVLAAGTVPSASQRREVCAGEDVLFFVSAVHQAVSAIITCMVGFFADGVADPCSRWVFKNLSAHGLRPCLASACLVSLRRWISGNPFSNDD